MFITWGTLVSEGPSYLTHGDWNWCLNFSYRKMLVIGSLRNTLVTLFTSHRDCFILIIDLPIKYSYLIFFFFVGSSLPPLRGPDLMGLIKEKGDCNCNPFVLNMKININSRNVCWKGRGILKCCSKLTVEWMCAFPWPRKIGCSEPPGDGGCLTLLMWTWATCSNMVVCQQDCLSIMEVLLPPGKNTIKLGCRPHVNFCCCCVGSTAIELHSPWLMCEYCRVLLWWRNFIRI